MELSQAKPKTKKDIIIYLFKNGLNEFEIIEKTGFSYSTVKESIRLYTIHYQDKKFFNVNSKDCWIFPTSEFKS